MIEATVSVGVAIASAASRPDTLIEAADAALYRAKAAGRNRVVVGDAVDGSPAPWRTADGIHDREGAQ